jgi:hypothetical protein
MRIVNVRAAVCTSAGEILAARTGRDNDGRTARVNPIIPIVVPGGAFCGATYGISEVVGCTGRGYGAR